MSILSRHLIKLTLSSTSFGKMVRGRITHFSMEIKEQKVNVFGQTINFVRTGNGNHSLLCFPGAMGTIWSDFRPQIDGLDKQTFDIVAWDPPGYGYSRPPDKKFTLDFYEKDADIANELMKLLGIKQFSLLGWSDGGISSMILAAKYPENVKKLVVWGANSYVLPEEIASYEKIRDIKKWSEKMKAPLTKLYGEDGLQHLWGSWCDVLQIMCKNGGNICKEKLPLIKCPTFILHGKLDPMVAQEHPKYLHEHIKNSRLHYFPEGKHNVHLRYADEFNSIITRFLEEL